MGEVVRHDEQYNAVVDLLHNACALRREGQVDEAVRIARAVIGCGLGCAAAIASAHQLLAEVLADRADWAGSLDHAKQALCEMNATLPNAFPAAATLLFRAAVAA